MVKCTKSRTKKAKRFSHLKKSVMLTKTSPMLNELIDNWITCFSCHIPASSSCTRLFQDIGKTGARSGNPTHQELTSWRAFMMIVKWGIIHKKPTMALTKIKLNSISTSMRFSNMLKLTYLRRWEDVSLNRSNGNLLRIKFYTVFHTCTRVDLFIGIWSRPIYL